MYSKIIGSKYKDEKGNGTLSTKDIIAISPFNVQRNLLYQNLSKKHSTDVRVATIDKIQGQEGKVVIISMTSSDAEDLPRNKAFFFNRNRLNVAISRAQCSSIILLNPCLLESAPTDYEEFKLINNFQKLMKFEVKTDNN